MVCGVAMSVGELERSPNKGSERPAKSAVPLRHFRHQVIVGVRFSLEAMGSSASHRQDLEISKHGSGSAGTSLLDGA